MYLKIISDITGRIVTYTIPVGKKSVKEAENDIIEWKNMMMPLR